MAKRFNPEQERILNEWARTASELRRAFPYTTASQTQTQGFGFLLNREIDPSSGFYIRVRESDGSVDLPTTYTLTFDSTDFDLQQTSTREILVTTIAGGADATTASNLGGGAFVFAQEVGDDLQFRTLTAGSNITINQTATEIEIASGGGGGFYGITIKQTNDAESFSGINVLSFDNTQFYLNQNSPNTDEVSVHLKGTLSQSNLNVGSAPGAIITFVDPDRINVSRLRFNRDDFYLEGTASNLIVNTGLVRSGGRPGGQTILGGNSTSAAKLRLAGNNALDANAFLVPSSNTITPLQPIVFEAPSGKLASGVNFLLSVPSSMILDGRGASGTNVIVGFHFQGVTLIDTAQTFTGSNAFVAANTIRETGPITSAHSAFNEMGYSAQPLYEIGHNGASTEGIPTLMGYSAEPVAKRETGKVGTGIVDVMAGYATNPPNPLRTFFSGQQINPGITVSKYAHFIAFSDGQLLNAGGTLTEEVGVDLQNINVGTTKISLRSTSTDAQMRHQGPVVFGGVGPAEIAMEDTITQVGFLFDGNAFSKDAVYVKYGGAPNHYVLARARGTSSAPLRVDHPDTLGAFQGYGYDGDQFEHGASITFSTDFYVSFNQMPTAITFKNRKSGDQSVTEFWRMRSNSVLTAVEGGRYAYTSAGGYTLTADQNNYDPDNVLGEEIPKGVWGLVASGAARTITGIQAPAVVGAADFHYLEIINAGSNNIVLAGSSVSSLAANRILFNGTACTLGPDECATLLYDNNSDRWRILSTTGAITP